MSNAKYKAAQESVDFVLKLVKGSKQRRPSDRDGDVDVNIDGVHGPIEVKRATKAGQVYQVRAIRFIPLVIHDPSGSSWYVISGSELVRIIGAFERGMHTGISFESRHMGLARESRGELTPFKVMAADLSGNIRKVLQEDQADPGLQNLMVCLQKDIEALQKKYSDLVREMK